MTQKNLNVSTIPTMEVSIIYEGSTESTSEQNAKHLYSEETLQIVTAKYDPYQTLWLTISYTSPEFISNLKAGIYE